MRGGGVVDAILLDVMIPLHGWGHVDRAAREPGDRVHPRDFPDRLRNADEVQRLEGMGARAVVAKPVDLLALPSRMKESLGAAAPLVAPGLPPAVSHDMGELRAQFVRRSEARIEMAALLLARLRETPAERQHLQDFMRFFHSLAGVGTSFGFPQVTALAKEGELQCLAFLHGEAAPSATECRELVEPAGGIGPCCPNPRPRPPAPPLWRGLGASTRQLGHRRAGDVVPLLGQEGHSTRLLATGRRPPSLCFLAPDALIVDAVLDDGSGYDVIDRLRGRPGGEGVPVSRP
jgi:CheY-like chemotaxis protein